ncbi:YibL family ribosome-associated protein [Ferrimonas sediminicola]|uniref:YibL family ribosome-associated protein n=1 Tax=Ferrimonas sediminicola TaxID=2569538 RepID=A0A4U1BFX9_9GAMM|nr:YibL family ribosome-associated protein [Ferrimonas sediminicola]TKB48921.1 YibL family ribosome-associated protein [Ferrimonas sediminicola]
MNLKQELQQLNNRLDAIRRKLDAAHERGDMAMIDKFTEERQALTKRIESVKRTQTRQLGKQGNKVGALPFKRPLTKEEQADLGKLKKSVRGLVVVHPMTALGREMGVTQVTGFSPKKF